MTLISTFIIMSKNKKLSISKKKKLSMNKIIPKSKIIIIILFFINKIKTNLTMKYNNKCRMMYG
jgi:hypothetical protein